MQNEEPSVTINDIALVVKLIDIFADRGTIKGEELMAVGQLRQKLVSFVEHASKEENKTEEETE